MSKVFNNSNKQRTISSRVSISGIGLHTGVETTATFKPAKPNSGIRFKRLDLEDCPEIIADIDHVVDISRGTTIGKNGFRIHTVEHILAAVVGLKIDNILIELTEKEPPVMDGSASPFVKKLIKAGIIEQDAHRYELVIDKTVTYSESNRGVDIHILPSDKFRITFMTDYNFSSLETQYTALYSLEDDFIDEFAPARTFCFFSEIEGMKKKGLIKGGDVSNAIVFLDKKVEDSEISELKNLLNIDSEVFCGENGILNGLELRFPNEPVRHKALDLIGDLALLGIPIRGHIIAARSGHAANVEFVKKIKKTFSNKINSKERTKNNIKEYDIHKILNILPHRYPFLLVDRILELVPGKTVKALKNVTFNEPFFQGHFPGQPVMPGVLLLEAMAQSSGFLVLNTIPEPESKLMYFTGINNSRFKKVVIPGDQLIFQANLVKFRMGTCKIEATAHVNGQLVCSAEFLSSIVERRLS